MLHHSVYFLTWQQGSPNAAELYCCHNFDQFFNAFLHLFEISTIFHFSWPISICRSRNYSSPPPKEARKLKIWGGRGFSQTRISRRWEERGGGYKNTSVGGMDSRAVNTVIPRTHFSFGDKSRLSSFMFVLVALPPMITGFIWSV